MFFVVASISEGRNSGQRFGLNKRQMNRESF